VLGGCLEEKKRLNQIGKKVGHNKQVGATYYFFKKILKVINQYIFIIHHDVPLMYHKFNYKLQTPPLSLSLGGCP